jgi:hypothetical protein
MFTYYNRFLFPIRRSSTEFSHAVHTSEPASLDCDRSIYSQLLDRTVVNPGTNRDPIFQYVEVLGSVFVPDAENVYEIQSRRAHTSKPASLDCDRSIYSQLLDRTVVNPGTNRDPIFQYVIVLGSVFVLDSEKVYGIESRRARDPPSLVGLRSFSFFDPRIGTWAESGHFYIRHIVITNAKMATSGERGAWVKMAIFTFNI